MASRSSSFWPVFRESISLTPLAAGMVVWPAVINAARGEHWLNDRLRRPALLSLGFAPVSLAAFFLLFLGRGYWAGWLHVEHLHNGAWLNSRFLFTRDLAALLLFWGMAAWSARDTRPQPGKGRAGWLAFIYCAVFSLLGFDLVMALDPHWVSSLFGGYFFITGMYIARTMNLNWVTPDEVLLNPLHNIRIGTRYLAALIDAYGVDGALAARRVGEWRAASWSKSGKANDVLPPDAREYMEEVLTLYEKLKQFKG